jgi:hypothetical protein
VNLNQNIMIILFQEHLKNSDAQINRNALSFAGDERPLGPNHMVQSDSRPGSSNRWSVALMIKVTQSAQNLRFPAGFCGGFWHDQSSDARTEITKAGTPATFFG